MSDYIHKITTAQGIVGLVYGDPHKYYWQELFGEWRTSKIFNRLSAAMEQTGKIYSGKIRWAKKNQNEDPLAWTEACISVCTEEYARIVATT